LPIQLHEAWNISGIVLAIGIDGDDRFVSVLYYIVEARPKGATLSPVPISLTIRGVESVDPSSTTTISKRLLFTPSITPLSVASAL
jgi:hypothetical protein